MFCLVYFIKFLHILKMSANGICAICHFLQVYYKVPFCLCRSKTPKFAKFYCGLASLAHLSEKLELFQMCHFRDILWMNLDGPKMSQLLTIWQKEHFALYFGCDIGTYLQSQTLPSVNKLDVCADFGYVHAVVIDFFLFFIKAEIICANRKVINLKTYLQCLLLKLIFLKRINN